MNIESIIARTVLDSRGNPTVEAEVKLANGVTGVAAVPSGASTGSHEAHELRDTDSTNWGGKGVDTAVHNINTEIATALSDMNIYDQFGIDQAMCNLDGTAQKSRLGANATLAVSLATAHAAAASKHLPLYQYLNQLVGEPEMSLPRPMMNILNGGQHAVGGIDIQECMIIPLKTTSIIETVRVGSEIFHALQKILRDNGEATTVGDEGGFSPRHLQNNSQVFELVCQAITAAGYVPGQDIVLAIDAAANEFYDNSDYTFTAESRSLSPQQLSDWYQEQLLAYPLVSIEDAFAEDDWEPWQQLKSAIPGNIQLVGDDLIVTNMERLQTTIDKQAANAVLVKPNQIGTLSETWRVIERAKQEGWATIISHRSGETEDTTIAHIAVGMGCGQIKTGSLSRTDRVAKYNELLRIAERDASLSMYTPAFGVHHQN